MALNKRVLNSETNVVSKNARVLLDEPAVWRNRANFLSCSFLPLSRLLPPSSHSGLADREAEANIIENNKQPAGEIRTQNRNENLVKILPSLT